MLEMFKLWFEIIEKLLFVIIGLLLAICFYIVNLKTLFILTIVLTITALIWAAYLRYKLMKIKTYED